MQEDNNAPVSQDEDIPNVSLVDTPLDQPLETQSTDTEGQQAEETDTDAQKTEGQEDAKTTAAKSGDDTKTEEGEGEDSKQTEEQQEDQSSAEDRKQAAARAWQERQRTRQQIAQQIDNEYAPKTADELIAEGTDPNLAAIEALRQEVAFKEERTRVAELTSGMRTEAVEVMNDFPVFDPRSPEYDEEFTKDVETSYKQAARLQTSEDGSLILNADVQLYDYYQRMARIYNRGTSRGNEQGQQQLAEQMARTENPGGSSSTAGPAPGSLEEMEQRLADVPIT